MCRCGTVHSTDTEQRIRINRQTDRQTFASIVAIHTQMGDYSEDRDLLPESLLRYALINKCKSILI